MHKVDTKSIGGEELNHIKRSTSKPVNKKLRKLCFNDLSIEEQCFVREWKKTEKIQYSKEESSKQADIKSFKNFRHKLNIKKCCKCGADMKGLTHHFLCNKCHGGDTMKSKAKIETEYVRATNLVSDGTEKHMERLKVLIWVLSDLLDDLD